VAVPDLLYERELAAYEGPELARLGLQVHAVDEAGVGRADGLRRVDRRISLFDAFALALAEGTGTRGRSSALPPAS
jgi:hypothetical protein